MSVKEFLGQALRLDGAINIHMEEIAQYRRLAHTVSSSRLEEQVSHSRPNEAPYAKWVQRIVDKEKELDAEIDRLVDTKLKISDFIGKVENPRWQCLLRSRYVMCKPWPDVAVDMNCGLSTVFRIHKKILETLEKKKFKNDIK